MRYWSLVAACLALTLPSVVSVAQTASTLPVGTYMFNVGAPVAKCEFNGSDISKTFVVAPEGAKFRYLQTATDEKYVVIQFLWWNDTTTNYRLFNVDGGARKTFCVERGTFERFSQKIYENGRSSYELTAGALILPVKMRFGGADRSFDFSKDITISTTGGFRWRVSETRENYFSALIGVGLSSVDLNPDNTKKIIDKSTDRAALTWIAGGMWDIDKFQFGAFVGQDRISQPNQGDWVYQGKTWLAVGLGYSLFGATSKKEDTSTNTKK